MRVFKIAQVVGVEIVFEARASRRAVSDFGGFMTNKAPTDAPNPGPLWAFDLVIGDGASQRRISIDLAPFLSAEEYDASGLQPFSLLSSDAIPCWYLFRDRFFVSERAVVTPADKEEVILRIKKAVYDEESELMALRSAVANIEAALDYQKSGVRREPIPDDVKLLVWSRDGGRCGRCGSDTKLHFDHIIPVAKGGGNGENNIQLLCETCNLKKSDRIAF